MKIETEPATQAKGRKDSRPAGKAVDGTLPLRWENILAPTDLSQPSRRAVETAAALAQKCRAKLILFHVVPCPTCASFDAPPDAGKLMDEARRSLDDIARTIPPDVTVEKIVRFGAREPVHQIVEEANNVSADLIVLATHGYSGLKRALLGSTAERVVRHAPCPVLVVRPADAASHREPMPKVRENSFKTN